MDTKQVAKAKLLDRAAVDPNLDAYSFRVLGVLLAHMNMETGLCCPSAKRVGELTASRRTP
jgi:hypothetical protein